MRKQRRTVAVCTAMLIAALTTLGLAGSASAKLVGEFTKFQFCPYTNPEVAKCTVAVTESGEVVLGSKTVPIVNPVTLQGGFGTPNKTTKNSKFFGATNGVTLAKVPQPVPGGLLGLVPPEGAPLLVKLLIEFAAENGLTGVNSTLELAQPASEIVISENNLARKEKVALRLPVKVHLENPILGSNCYVGSSTTPIIWELTSGKTAPPAPNESIVGSAGKVSFLEEGLILHLAETSLVDNAWSAPSASGCGGILSALIDPIINAVAGLPSAAGHNTAILNNTVDITTPGALEFINEENP